MSAPESPLDLLKLAERLAAVEETLAAHGVRIEEHHRALGTGQVMATEELAKGITRVERMLAKMAEHWGMPLEPGSDQGGG